MAVFSTDRFVSIAAAGADWREAARGVLGLLENHMSGVSPYNLGFLYITDYLAPEAQNLLALMRSVTKIDKWVGTVGLGVCGMDGGYIDEPAISVMLGRFAADDFRIFQGAETNMAAVRAVLEPWLEKTEPMLSLVHGDPLSETDPAWLLAEYARFAGGYVAGGLCSSRTNNIQFAGSMAEGDLSGVIFAQGIPVAAALTQGCAPLGPIHTITRCEDHVLMELDGRRAIDVFIEDMRRMVLAGKEDLAGKSTAALLEDYAALIKGEIHVAFPVSGSDQRDYLVRGLAGIDPDNGWIAVGHGTANGDHIIFVHRNDGTVRADLSRMLVEIRTRVIREKGAFAPAGALYISCVARAASDFGGGPGSEMKLVREVLGDIPLAGFYANGEISNGRLYGYTGILILFL